MRGVLLFIFALLFLSPLIELIEFERLCVIVALETLDVEFLKNGLHSGSLNAFHADLRTEE